MNAQAAARTPRLSVTTRAVEDIEDLLSYADPHETLAFLRRGEGIVGLAGSGIATALHTSAPADAVRGTRTRALSIAWQSLCAAAHVDDDVHLPGTGLVGFGALAFDERSAAASTILVPYAIIGRRGGRTWLTRIRVEGRDHLDHALAPVEYGPYWSATLGPGSLDPHGYQTAVRSALDSIGSGEVSKVVLARDLSGTVPPGADLRRLARALSSGYPDCWTYAVDGMMGASPETLITATGGTVTARVLAGTAPRGADADADTAEALALATSAKDQDEHLYAVQSVLASLRPHTRTLAVSDQPFTLRLPNVWHLATDIEAQLSGEASALDLIGALHPTAAVAGTPTDAALEVIRRIEPFDRGHYAGPVGWIDGDGDGEWAIALRGAQFGVSSDSDSSARPTPVTAYAGAGIVAGSDPESELLETRMKFRPIVDALA